MHRFTYHEPGSAQEAVKLLSELENAKLLAGGTDLLPGMRKGFWQPKHVINLKTAANLSDIKLTASGVEIGAAATMYETEKFLHLRPGYGILCQAIHLVASCQIRNRATVAGNLCNASPAADTASALVAMNASVRVLGLHGERIIPVEKLFIGPRRSLLEKNELVTAVILPDMAGIKGIFLRKSRRPSVDLATVNVAATFDGSNVRIALGAVAPTVVRASAAEIYIAERGITQETAREAARLAKQAANPITDQRGTKEYRLELVQVLTERALLALAGGVAQ